ncbi:MAG: hypothetical protein R6X25_02810 [Candidatus Krumholzibacteriia bacterium]
MRSLQRVIMIVLATGALALSGMAGSAAAQSFTRLQVLLPGETPAPGTVSGKLGTPDAQTVGVPFVCGVRACDDTWNTVADITDVVRLGSSDAVASLPGDVTLVAGEAEVTVTFNATGTFVITADDLSDPTIPQATSSTVDALVLNGFVFGSINQKNQYAGHPMSITLSAVAPGGEVVTGYDGPVHLRQITSYGIGRIEPAVVELQQGRWSGQVTMYRADETSINRGNVNIQAYLAEQPAKNGTSDPFTVHPGTLARVQLVVPGQDPLPGSISGVSGYPATQAAGQAFQVDVYATDSWWNPLTSEHTVRIVSSDPAANTPLTGALSQGHATFSVALGTAGTQTLTVADQTSSAVTGMTSAAIPVIPSGVHHFEIDPLPATVQAGEPVTVTIRATDSGGNTLPEYTGDAFLSANTGAATISPESIRFTAGIWTGAMVFRGAGGAVQFTCSDYSSPPHTGSSGSFVVTPGPYSGLQVLVPGEQPQGGSADGRSGIAAVQAAGTPFNVTIRAVDDFFNRVPGIGSRIELTSTDANLGAPAELSLNNGEIVVPVTLYRAGFQTLTAADLDSAGIADGTSSRVEVTAGVYEQLLILAPGESVSPGAETGRTGTATDQSISFAFTVTVLAVDHWFNPVSGITDAVAITCSDPLAELPPDEAMVDGRADLNVRLSTGGYQQITATAVGAAAIAPSTTQVRAISSGLHLEAVVSPTVVQAGEAFTLTVRVTNDAGSVIQEINTHVDVEVRNAATQEPGLGTLHTTSFQILQGQRSVAQTYTCAETVVFVVYDEAGNPPAVTEPLTVLPGPPATILLTSEPSWVRANRHATLTARVVDAHDNGVPDQAIAFAVIAGEGSVSGADEVTGVQGTATADFLAPLRAQMSIVRATAGGLAADLDLETALVDPDAAGGTVTNYPNPFHPGEAATTIAYVLDGAARVRLRIYTLSGGLVVDRQYAAGEAGGTAGLNEVTWNGRNGAGDPVASGGYILHVEAEAEGATMHVMRRKLGVVW